MTWTRPDRLRVGERIIFESCWMAGTWEVVSVNDCAATIRETYAAPRTVVLPDGRSFEATSGGRRLTISPYSQARRA